jgi:hypothetical protein
MGTACAEDGQLGLVVAGGAGTTLGKAATMTAPASPSRRLPPKITQGGGAHTDNVATTKGHLSEAS